jgi:hypothetical protein
LLRDGNDLVEAQLNDLVEYGTLRIVDGESNDQIIEDQNLEAWSVEAVDDDGPAEADVNEPGDDPFSPSEFGDDVDDADGDGGPAFAGDDGDGRDAETGFYET